MNSYWKIFVIATVWVLALRSLRFSAFGHVQKLISDGLAVSEALLYTFSLSLLKFSS